MKKYLNEILYITGLSSIVCLFWQGLELLILGKIMPNTVDTIISIILTLSLYGNLKYLCREEDN